MLVADDKPKLAETQPQSEAHAAFIALHLYVCEHLAIDPDGYGAQAAVGSHLGLAIGHWNKLARGRSGTLSRLYTLCHDNQLIAIHWSTGQWQILSETEMRALMDARGVLLASRPPE